MVVHVSFISVTEVLVTQWLVHVSFISATEVLVTQWLVHVSFISVTEVLVTQWLVHVSFISVTEVLMTQWLSITIRFLTAKKLQTSVILEIIFLKIISKTCQICCRKVNLSISMAENLKFLTYVFDLSQT